MINFALFGTIARSALIGAFGTKAVETLILSKVNNKMESKRWLKTTKLELFSRISIE